MLHVIQVGHPTIAAAQDKTWHINQRNFPQWVVSPPKDCFFGISKPSQSIENARQQALGSAVSQIIQAMGAEYSLTHESVLSGDHSYSKHELTERLSYSAKWFLKSIHQNIKEYRFIKRPEGYLCFVLLKVTPLQIQSLRKLTIGPKIAARCIKPDDETMRIEVRELNDVGVNLTGYDVSTLTKNRHASLITLFAWKVPESSVQEYQGVLDIGLHLRKSSDIATVYLHPRYHRLTAFILGARSITNINLTGYDEVGRQITVPVTITR